MGEPARIGLALLPASNVVVTFATPRVVTVAMGGAAATWREPAYYVCLAPVPLNVRASKHLRI